MKTVTKETSKIMYYFILFGLILSNLLVFLCKMNSTLILLLIGTVAFYKAYISDNFSDIYNIHSFKFTFTSNNILELVGSILVGTIISSQDIIAHEFNIITISFFIMAVAIVYRLLFFDLSVGTSNKSNHK